MPPERMRMYGPHWYGQRAKIEEERDPFEQCKEILRTMGPDELGRAICLMVFLALRDALKGKSMRHTLSQELAVRGPLELALTCARGALIYWRLHGWYDCRVWLYNARLDVLEWLHRTRLCLPWTYAEIGRED